MPDIRTTEDIVAMLPVPMADSYRAAHACMAFAVEYNPDRSRDEEMKWVVVAQVHATLALAIAVSGLKIE